MDAIGSIFHIGRSGSFLFIIFLVFALCGLVMGSSLLRRLTGKTMPPPIQGMFVWLTAYAIFKYILQPSLPASQIYTYMGIVTIGVFLFITSTNSACRSSIDFTLSTLQGKTLGHKLILTLTFFLIPYGGYALTRHLVTPPQVGEPIELRSPHPLPPRTMTVHGVHYELQTTKNPFRTN